MSISINQENLEKRAQQFVEVAIKAGADASDAVAITSMSLGVEVRDGKVEETERAESDAITLRVFVGKQVASVSSNQIDGLTELAERAVAMAQVAPENPYAGLADQEILATDLLELDVLDEVEVSPNQLTENAKSAEESGLTISGVSKSGGASASCTLSGLVLATSHGFSGAYLTSRHGISMMAIAGEGTAMERDYEFDYRTHYSDLDTPASIGKSAGERAVRRLNPQKLDSTTGTVVYDPRVARSIVGHLIGAINGSSIARNTSFLKDKLNQQIFPEHITVIDDPHKKRGHSSRPFDGEGVATLPLNLIEAGKLKCWLLDSASAKELGLKTNGRAERSSSGTTPSSTNVILQPGEKSPKELIKDIGTGLYVTDLIGHGANTITGDYSRGASGFWIENGEITYPVSELTIAGNLNDMFANVMTANDLDDRYSISTPTIAIGGMTIGGR